MPSPFFIRHYQPKNFYHLSHHSPFVPLFKNEQDYQFFTLVLAYYLRYPKARSLTYLSRVKKPYSRTKLSPQVSASLKLLAYTLTPTHFHLLLYYANPAASPTDLMRRLSITYAMYYQKKYQTTVPLFPKKYKSILVPDEKQLLYLSKFIHSHVPHHSSYPSYLNSDKQLPWIKTNLLLSLPLFKSSPNPHKKYQHFVNQEPLPPDFDPTLKLCE